MTPAETVETIARRMDALEERVARLERQESEPAQPPLAALRVDLELARQAPEAAVLSGSVLSTAGIALLGIAGAYVLRAVAGTAVLPRPVGALLDAAYAVGWLYFAARNGDKNRTGAAIYALSSVLMLGPMLWEMCVRFQAMPGWAGAALLGMYAIAAAVFARGNQRAGWFSIAWAGAAVVSLALAVGVRAMLPFAAILLAMAAWGEISRLRGRPMAVHGLVIVAADLSAGALLWIYRMPMEARPEYPDLPWIAVAAVPLSLLLSQCASIAVLAVWRGERIAVFDMAQVSLALGLAGWGLLALDAPGGHVACVTLCVVVGCGCYAAAFARRPVDSRNFALFVTWGPGLLSIAVFFAMDAAPGSAVFGLLAVTAGVGASRIGSKMLALHAVIYVLLAEGTSGLLLYTVQAVSGPALGALSAGMVVSAIAAAVVYGTAREEAGEPDGMQVLYVGSALLAVWPANALLTHGLVRSVGIATAPTVFHMALVRTIALCGLAILLTLAGNRLQRQSLVRAAYTLAGFAALKLFFEDLRHGRLDFAAGSIFLVALAMIAIPRIAAKKRAA